VIARLFNWLRSRREQERGAVLILTAVSMVVLLAAGAMGVDVGFTMVGSRTAQAMADTAAEDLIQYINAADQELNMTGSNSVQSYLTGELANVLTDNASTAQLYVTPMLYQAGKYTIPSAGCQDTVPFHPTVPVCNAVAVTAKVAVPQPFWGGFNDLIGKSGSGLPAGSGGCGVTTSGGCGAGCNGSACFSCPTGGCTSCPTTACYAWTPQSCFSVGSYLVSFNSQQSAVLNVILSQLGTSASVTAVGYQGLANTYVSLNQLITASGSLLTASNVLTTSLSASQWLAIFTDAVNNQTASGQCSTGTTLQSNAESALASLDFAGSNSVELCQLLSVNGSTCTSDNTLSYDQLSSGVNVLQMLTTEAELANGTSGFNVTTALGVTGVTSATLDLDVVQPAQIALGPVGSYTSATPCPATSGTSTCAETAQVSANLALNVPVVGLIDIPLSAADASATLLSVTCVNNAMTATKINAATTAATAALTLGGSSFATLSISGTSASVGYSAGVVPPSASTTSSDPPTNPLPVTNTNPTPSFTVTNASLYALANTGNLLSSTLVGFYEPVLQAAGVSVGDADVADLGTDCDAIGPTA
jgi:uncharacterized membrane protein